MKCVFLNVDDECYAEMIFQRGAEIPWKVDETTKKQYCTMNDFIQCPRFIAKMGYLTKAPVKK